MPLVTKSQLQLPILPKANTQKMNIVWKGIGVLFKKPATCGEVVLLSKSQLPGFCLARRVLKGRGSLISEGVRWSITGPFQVDFVVPLYSSQRWRVVQEV